MNNYYKTLGLQNFCDDQEKIKQSYRAQVKFFHPDSGNVSQEIAEEKTKQLNIAYDTLSDYGKKQIYDSQLRSELSGNSSSYSNYGQNYSNRNTYNTHNYSGYTNNHSSTNTNNNYQYRNSSYTNQNNGNYRYNTSYKKKTVPNYVFYIILIIGILYVISVPGSGNNSNTSNTYQNNSISDNADSKLTPVSVSNGHIFKQPNVESNCEFTVKTSGSNGYYIYLKDFSSGGSNDISFYVKGGNTVSVMVPEGRYKLYYASGSTWYGLTNKFGSNTSYSTSDDIFSFSHEIKGDYIYYDSWTVTLYPVTNGNMETEKVDADEFPG